MVNLHRSSNAEQAEVTETFPRRERGAAEARGDRPPLRRRWVPAALRPPHRSMPRAARPPAGDVCHFSPRDSAPQRPLRDIVSALSAIFASDDKVIYVSLLRPGTGPHLKMGLRPSW